MGMLVVSASLNPASNSRLLALEAQRVLAADGERPAWLDLQKLPLPLCDGDTAYDDSNVATARAQIAAADGVLTATPVYNYDVNAALKNLVELTGRAWENKVVGFLCAAGGQSSYMSVVALANSLMLDFRCVIVPRFVYATDDAFADGRLVDPAVTGRVAECARTTVRFARALRASQGIPRCGANFAWRPNSGRLE